MYKLISLVLSFCLLFTSLAPSYAEVVRANNRDGRFLFPSSNTSGRALRDSPFLPPADLRLPKGKALNTPKTKYGSFLKSGRALTPWDYHLEVKDEYEQLGRESLENTGIHEMWDPYMTVTYYGVDGKVVLGTDRMLITQWMYEEKDYRDYINHGGEIKEEFAFDLNYQLAQSDTRVTGNMSLRGPLSYMELEFDCSMRRCEAQVEDAVRAAAFKAMIDRLISQIQDGMGNILAQASLNQEVQDAVAYLTGKGEEEARYRAFKKMFRSGLEKDIETAVNEVVSNNPGASADDVAEVKTAWLEDEMKEEKVRAAYNQMEERSRAEGIRYYPGAEYLKELSHRVVTSGGINIVQEGLPVFAAYGGVEEADKKKGAEILRADLLDVTNKCVAAVKDGKLSAGQENACVSALEDVSGLAVLGERGESNDAAAIYQFFDKGYNSAFGGYIIMTSVPALHALGAGNYILDVMDKAGAKKEAASGWGQKVMQASDGSDQAVSPYMAGTWILGLEGSLYQTESGEFRSGWTDAGAYLGKAAAEGDPVAGWIIDNHAGRTVGFEEHNRWRYGVSFTFPSFTAGVLESGSYKRIVEKLKGKNGYERVKQLKNNAEGTWRDYLFLALYDHNKIDLDVKAWNDINNRLVNEWSKDPNHARRAVSVSMDGSGSASGSGSSWQNMVYRDELPHNMQEQVKCVYILNDAMGKIGVMIDALGILMLIDGLAAIAKWGWTKAFNIKMARMGEMGQGVKLYNVKGMHKLLRAQASQRAAYFAQRGQALVAEGERLAASGNAAAAESYFVQAETMAAKATRFTPFMGVDRGAAVGRQVTRARQGVNVSKTMNTISTGAAEVQELAVQGNISAAGSRLQALRNEVSAMQRAGVGRGKAYTKNQFQRAQQSLKEAESVFAKANAADALQGVARVRNAFAANNYQGAYEALNSLRAQVAAMKEARAGKNKMYSKEQYQQARTALSEAESIFGSELEAARTNLLAKARLEGKRLVELPQYDAARNRIVMTWTEVEPMSPGVKPTFGKSFSDWWLEKRLSAQVSLDDFRRSMQAIIDRPISFAKNMAVAFSLNFAPLQADAASLFNNSAHTITLSESASGASAGMAAEGTGASVGGVRAPLTPAGVVPWTPVAVTPENWRLINNGNFWKTSVGKSLTFGEQTLFAVQGLTPRFVLDYQRDLAQWNLLNNRYASAGVTDNARAGWNGSIAFNQYQQQLNNWLYRSNPLYLAQNPWMVGHWWDDVKTSIALGWQEFNLSRYSNPDYVNFKASSIPQAAAEEEFSPAALDEVILGASLAAVPVPASQGMGLPSSSSGMLYSGVPVMDMFRFGSKVWKRFLRLFGQADVVAEDVLSRKVPLVTELRDIVTGNASRSLKEQALLRLHRQFNAFDQVIKNLPEDAQNNVRTLESKNDDKGIKAFLYTLYEGHFLDELFSHLNNHIPTDLLAQELAAITSTPEFDAARRAVYDDTPVLSPESNAFTGVVQSLQNVDEAALKDALRMPGWAVQNADDGKEVSGGWIYYKNNIPVYYRNSKGVLSSEPVVLLTQPSSSWFASFLAALQLPTWFGVLRLSTPKGIKIPKGMVLAIDENGKFKFVLQPGHRNEMLHSKAAETVMDSVYKNGAYAVDVDTPYSTTDLLAVAKCLEQGIERNFQLKLNPPNSFKAFVNMLGAFFGLNVDSTMVGPFKDAAKAAESPMIRSSAPNLFGGVGYVTPRVAGELTPLMQEWGMDKSVFAVLSVSLATLLTSVALGIDGLHPIKDFSLVMLALPMVVLVLSASLLRSAAPLLLNHYKDPRRRTAANLQMSSFQQGAKVALAGLTAVWAGAGEEFVAIPAAALLAAVTLGLFFNTSMGKKVGAELKTALKNPKSSAAALWRGAKLVTPKLLLGLFTGVTAPLIAVWNKMVGVAKKLLPAKSESEAAVREDTDQERYQREFEKDFLTDTETKNSRMRVTAAYASYAASIMILNQLAKESMGDWGQWAVTLFAVASLFVRLFATSWVSKGKFTDDQLTGISFAGLTAMPLLLALLPYTGWGVVGIFLAGIGLNMSTAVPGQLDNTRLQNNVTAKMQQRKNAILQDANLSAEEKQAKIADLEAMEKHWAAQASKVYNKANANGIYGVYAAVIASLVFPLFTEDWSWMARAVFAYSSAVAAVGAWKTKDQAFSFVKALFSKKKRLVITDEDVAGNKISAATFGIADETKANKLLPGLVKGKDSLKTLKEQVAPYGMIAIASEVKLTKVLKRMIEIHNRLVASAELLGNASVQASFETLHSLAKDYAAVMGHSKVSLALQREFGKLVTALCVDGDLAKGILEKPSYMREGEFDIPANYRNLLEARDIILEMRVLVRNINQGGSAVTQNTYRRFLQYHAEAKRLLQAYMAENPSESAVVKAEEENIRALCQELKESNLLREHAGQTSAKDIQDLEDLLQAY